MSYATNPADFEIAISNYTSKIQFADGADEDLHESGMELMVSRLEKAGYEARPPSSDTENVLENDNVAPARTPDALTPN